MRKYIFVFIAVLVLLILTGCPEPVIDFYTVFYDGNGADTGTSPTDIHLYEESTAVTILNNTGNLQKNNVIFSGWNTEADGSGTDRIAGETFNMGTGSLVLYAKWKFVFAIGDTGPAGGYIIYIDEADAFSWNYLEAAPSDISSFLLWDGGGATETFAYSQIIGSGFTNTMKIISKEGLGDYAASRCYDLAIGSYDDWFLPSQDEILLMYNNLYLSGIGNFEHTSYWCSTQDSSSTAFRMLISSGNISFDFKYNANYVRAIRAF